MRVRNAVSLAWGVAIGCLTFAAGPIGWASANPIIAAFQWALLILIMPGIIGGGAVGGSMHTIFLGIAALINALLHFGICWLLFPLFSRSSLKRANRKVLTAVAAMGLGVMSLQGQSPEVNSFQNAIRLFKTGHLAEAELEFRELVGQDPSNVAAQMYLGQTLFREQKFSDAIAPYEKARDLEKAGAKLTLTQHRILGDQLAMAYGISGRTADSKALLRELVRTDPEYPLNYYNLACVAADEDDKPGVLKNLTEAFQHRAHILPGEQMPDPASDPSFQKYAHDGDFKALVSRLKD
jgi:tetratricopeptide (TPR) repeat protein